MTEFRANDAVTPAGRPRIREVSAREVMADAHVSRIKAVNAIGTRSFETAAASHRAG